MGLLGWITSEYAKAAKAFLPLIPVEQFPHLNGISQEVIAGRHDGLHQLEFGIERQAYIAYQITI